MALGNYWDINTGALGLYVFLFQTIWGCWGWIMDMRRQIWGVECLQTKCWHAIASFIVAPTFLLGDTLKVHRHKILLQECLSKQNGRLLLCAINDGTGREGDWVSLIRWKRGGYSGGRRGVEGCISGSVQRGDFDLSGRGSRKWLSAAKFMK